MKDKYIAYLLKKLKASKEDSAITTGHYWVVYNYGTTPPGPFEDALIARVLAAGCQAYGMFATGDELTIFGKDA